MFAVEVYAAVRRFVFIEGNSRREAARMTKSASVIALLQRERGATLAEMIEATGWLPHTTRAALTGLKKKGHVIARDKRGDVTCYCITPAAA